MAIGIGFRSQDTMDAAILPAREHACKLISVTETEGLSFDKTETVQQLKWTFEAINWKSPEGKPGVISMWSGLYYGSTKAKLTALLDQFFGRSLSQAEASLLDMEKMAGSVKGYVMVVPHKKQDNTMTTKFGAFRLPDNQTPPDPQKFYRDDVGQGSPQPNTFARSSAAPAAPAGGGAAVATMEPEVEALTDPFDEELTENPFGNEQEA